MVWWPSFIRRPKIRLSHIRLGKIPKPNATVLFFASLLFTVYVFGGGIYMIVNADKPWMLPLGRDPNTGAAVIVTGGLDSQLMIEGLVSMIFMLIGFFGTIIVYDSNKHAYAKSYAQKLIMIGIFMVIVSFVGFWWLFQLKL